MRHASLIYMHQAQRRLYSRTKFKNDGSEGIKGKESNTEKKAHNVIERTNGNPDNSQHSHKSNYTSSIRDMVTFKRSEGLQKTSYP